MTCPSFYVSLRRKVVFGIEFVKGQLGHQNLREVLDGFGTKAYLNIEEME
jgi:hypothetical protein